MFISHPEFKIAGKRPILSVVFNVLNCIEGTEILLRFCQNKNNEVTTIEVYCKNSKVKDGLEYLKKCYLGYPQHILDWVQLQNILSDIEKIVVKNV